VSIVVKYEFPDSLANCSSTIDIEYRFFTVPALRALESMHNRHFPFALETNIADDAYGEVLLLMMLCLSRRSN